MDNFDGISNAEIEKILESEDTALKKWSAWMEASQPILLPNLFGYSNYVVYKPQYPGYYEYIAQRAAFYSIAGKALLWLALIHGFYCMYVYGWFDNALTNDNPTSLTNRVTDLKAQRRVMNTYLKGKGGLKLVWAGLGIVTVCCVVLFGLCYYTDTKFLRAHKNLTILTSGIFKKILDWNQVLTDFNNKKLPVTRSLHKSEIFTVFIFLTEIKKFQKDS